jgi:hypothetical protein
MWPHSVAGQAPAQREQATHELVGVVAGRVGLPRAACQHRRHAGAALRQKNASAYELGELHSMPRSRSRLEKRSSLNQSSRAASRSGSSGGRLCAGAVAPRSARRRSARHVAVVLRHLVLEEQVITEGVPGQRAADRRGRRSWHARLVRRGWRAGQAFLSGRPLEDRARAARVRASVDGAPRRGAAVRGRTLATA